MEICYHDFFAVSENMKIISVRSYIETQNKVKCLICDYNDLTCEYTGATG